MKQGQPSQQQNPPGTEEKMIPKPESENPNYKAAGKFTDKVVVITGGDSGIGKATAITFAKEGADVAIIYNASDQDAKKTAERIQTLQRECLVIKGNIDKKTFCEQAIQQVIEKFGKINVLVNNAGEQHPQENIEDITEEQLLKTFQTN